MEPYVGLYIQSRREESNHRALAFVNKYKAAGLTILNINNRKLTDTMDLKVLYNLTYGLYIVGVEGAKGPAGCVINTCFQVTSENPKLAISLNKNNYTLEAIKQQKKFTLSILAESSDPFIISMFGFCSSRDHDKYEDFGVEKIDGVPAVKGEFCGRLVLEMEQTVDCGTHEVVIARLVDTQKGEGIPMTYAYYHDVIKGKAPKNAPTYRAEE